MAKGNTLMMIPDERIIEKIYFIRGHKVMLDSDLAKLYKVETRRLNEQVKRNAKRFPPDFMFQLTKNEAEILMSQFATSNWGGSRKLPYAFTEHGVLMLSSVLNSDRAIQTNIKIMRIFTHFRQLLTDNTELRIAIEKLEKKTENNVKNIELVFQYLDELLEKKEKPRRQIGYKLPKKRKQVL
jgi:hypothetical protein